VICETERRTPRGGTERGPDAWCCQLCACAVGPSHAATGHHREQFKKRMDDELQKGPMVFVDPCTREEFEVGGGCAEASAFVASLAEAQDGAALPVSRRRVAVQELDIGDGYTLGNFDHMDGADTRFLREAMVQSHMKPPFLSNRCDAAAYSGLTGVLLEVNLKEQLGLLRLEREEPEDVWMPLSALQKVR
jgi:hypothetical protein